MNLSEHYEQLRRYDVWANREIIASLQKQASPPARCTQLLAHIIGAEYVWLARLNQSAPPVAVWPEMTLPQCEEHIGQLDNIWTEYCAKHLPAGLEDSITYKNSKGEPWSSRVQDVLTHVFLHSAYHRGQIASEMRRAGYTPAYTDFIHAVRQELIA